MLRRQIGFAVNVANKTLLRQAVRTENVKETEKKQVDQNCNYFFILKNETDTVECSLIGIVICGH